MGFGAAPPWARARVAKSATGSFLMATGVADMIIALRWAFSPGVPGTVSARLSARFAESIASTLYVAELEMALFSLLLMSCARIRMRPTQKTPTNRATSVVAVRPG